MRPIRLDLKPSRLLAAIFAAAGFGASLILLFMPLPIWLKLGLTVLVLASAAYHIMDALLRLPWSLIALELNGKGELHVIQRDDAKQQMQILPTSVVMPVVTLLNLRIKEKFWRRHMLITPERVDPEVYRQLRVWLRWSRQAVSDAVAEDA